jgi:hypothetical protein
MEWFRRLGEIPGIEYTPPASIDRVKLRGHDFEPTVRSFDGGQRKWLFWPSLEDGGAGTRSVVSQHVFPTIDDRQISSQAVIQRLWEAVELPGQPRDYHFALQRAADVLWERRRRSEAGVLRTVEQIAWLDIELVEIMPTTIHDEENRNPIVYTVTSFQTLRDLYLREGFLCEALAVARRAERLDQSAARVADLEARLEALRTEDGAE